MFYMVQVPLTCYYTKRHQSRINSRFKICCLLDDFFKRVGYNFALQRAVEWENQLSQPLLILEPLILDYPMSSIRFHKFTLEGMKEVHETVQVLRFTTIHLLNNYQRNLKDY